MSRPRYLPSKKFIYIFTGCLIVVIGFFVITILKKNAHEKYVATQRTTRTYTVSQIIDGDRDADGVRDWEEALWGTDPDNIDTNADGVNDLADINARKEKIAAENTDVAETGEAINETDQFSRNLFASVISLSEKGALTDEAIADLGEKLTASAAAQVNLPDRTTIDKIKSVPTSATAQKTYVKNVADLLAKYDSRGVGREGVIYGKYIISEDETVLEELNQVGGDYQKFSNEMIELSVPESSKALHLRLINALYNTGVALLNIAQAWDNPLISEIGVGQYKKYSKNLEDTVGELSPLLPDDDIL